MQHMNKMWRRALALLLTITMCLGMLNLTAFAADGDSGAHAPVSEPAPNAGELPGDDGSGSDEAAAPVIPPEHSDRVPDNAKNEAEKTESVSEDGNAKNATSTATWETEEDGSQTSGREDTSTTVTTGKDEATGAETVTTETKSDLIENTTNAPQILPDGSTVTSGSSHTEGWEETAEKTTFVTPGPGDTPPPTPSLDDDEIKEKLENTDPTLVEKGKYEEVETTPDPNDTPVPTLEPADVSTENSKEWLGEGGITITLKPGAEPTATTIPIPIEDEDKVKWEASVQKKMDEVGKDKTSISRGSEEFAKILEENQLTDIVGEGDLVYKDEATGSIIIVSPTKTPIGDKEVLTGYTVKTYGEGKKSEDDALATPIPGDNGITETVTNVQGEKTTFYAFEKPADPPAAGFGEPDANGNVTETIVTTLESPEWYIENEDGTFTLVEVETDEEGNLIGNLPEGAKHIEIGYTVSTITRDSQGNQVATSARTEFAQVTETTRTPTNHTTKWEVVTDSKWVPVIRDVTIEEWNLILETLRGGDPARVWAELSAVRDHGVTSGDLGLEVDQEEPEEGKTDTSTDLYNRADGKAFVYEITASSMKVRDTPGWEGKQVGSSPNTSVVTVYETEKGEDGTVWGRIGTNQWIALSWTESKYTITASSLNIRTGAGTNYSKAGKLKQGDKVTITGTKKVGNTLWGRIGDDQWISLSYGKENSSTSETGTTITLVVDSSDGELNVRSEAGKTQGDPVEVLKNGDTLRVYETKPVNGSTWGRIGDNKWVNLKFTKEYDKFADPDEQKATEAGKFLFIAEYGLESALRVNGTDADTWQAHQFVIRDDQGNKHYVYCADFEVDPKANITYDEQLIDENTTGKWYAKDQELTQEQAKLLNSIFGKNADGTDKYSAGIPLSEEAAKEANQAVAKRVQDVALNGYWGTGGNGTGSLENVQQQLIKAMEDPAIKEILGDDITADQIITSPRNNRKRQDAERSATICEDDVAARRDKTAFYGQYRPQ